MSNLFKYLGYSVLFLFCLMLALIVSIPITFSLALFSDQLFNLSRMPLAGTLLCYGAYAVCVLLCGYQLVKLALKGINGIKQLRAAKVASLAKSVKANLVDITLFACCLIVALCAMYFIDVLLAPVYLSSYMISTLLDGTDGRNNILISAFVLLMYGAILLLYAFILFRLIRWVIHFANRR